MTSCLDVKLKKASLAAADVHASCGFHPLHPVRGVFGDAKARAFTFVRRYEEAACGPMVAGTRVPMIAARAGYGAAERRHSYLFRLRGALRAAPQFSPEYLAFLAGKLAYARLHSDGHAVKELDGMLPAIRNAELNAEISSILLRDDPFKQ